MKSLIRLLIVATLSLFCVSPVFALGTNITIYDGNGDEFNGSIGGEDEEVEPGMQTGQKWDLEGFFFDQSNTLSMVGGYNFVTGEGDYTSGDIFISKDAAPQYGDIHRNNDAVSENDGDGYDNQSSVLPTYGYEYVLDLDFNLMIYTVLGLDVDTVLQSAYYQQNEGSSPWQYVSGGVDTSYSGSFTFSSITTSGFSGDNHYLLTGFDLSFLGHETDFYSHFTMGCGNDNLMGQGTVVPEPSTFLLMGAGGGLLWLARRRKDRK